MRQQAPSSPPPPLLTHACTATCCPQSQEEADPWDADPHAATRAEDAQAYRAVRLVLQGHGQGAEARPAGGAAAAAAAAVVAAVAQVAQLVEVSSWGGRVVRFAVP